MVNASTLNDFQKVNKADNQVTVMTHYHCI